MSERLDNAAEILKLERLLTLPAGELAFLESVPSSELRDLRDQVTNSLFDAGEKMLTRLGAAAKLLPSPLVATIAEKSFGPLLCARAAGKVDPSKAIDVSKRLSPVFLADATIELDPRRVAAIIAGVPTSLVKPVSAELGKRREFVTMGRFLAYVPDDAIAAALEVLDDEAVLRTAFVLEHKEALNNAIGVLPPARLPGVLKTAAVHDLWPEALDLLGHLRQDLLIRVAEVVAGLDDDEIDSLIRAVQADDLWGDLTPVIAQMSEASRLRMARVPAFSEAPVITGLLAGAITDRDALLAMLRVLGALPDAGRASLIEVIDASGPDLATALVQTIGDPSMMAEAVASLPEDVMAAVERASDRAGLRDVLDAARQG